MILGSMFRGNFAPMELLSPSDPEYKKLNQEICALTDKLKNHLISEDRAALDTIMKKVYTAQAIECESYFCFALAVGMQLQAEVLEQLRRLEVEEV